MVVFLPDDLKENLKANAHYTGENVLSWQLKKGFSGLQHWHA